MALSARGWNCRHNRLPACLSRTSSSMCSLRRLSVDVSKCWDGTQSGILSVEHPRRNLLSGQPGHACINAPVPCALIISLLHPEGESSSDLDSL